MTQPTLDDLAQTAPQEPDAPPAPQDYQQPAQPQPETQAPEPAPELEPEPAAPEQGDLTPYLERLIAERAAEIAQQLLEEQRMSEEQWREAQELFEKLNNDDEFYEEYVKKHGLAATHRFMADFLEQQELREQGSRVSTQWIQRVNQQQVNVLPAVVQQSKIASLLPAQYRDRISEIRYDPQQPWILTLLDTIAEAWQAREKELRSTVTKAAQTARAASQNNAKGPLPSGGSAQPLPDHEIIRRYGLGDPSVTLADYLAAKQRLGQDY